MKNLVAFISIVILTGFWMQLSGQIQSEGELIKEADTRFGKAEYDEAVTLYSRLLSIYPENPFYSYRYSVSCLYADRSDLARTLKYLEYAAEKGVDDENTYYYLGLARYHNLEFGSAIEAFRRFLASNANDHQKADEVNLLISFCENGQSLLKINRVNNIVETRVSDRSNFFRAYPSTGLVGKILIKPDIFQSAEDLKREESGLIVMPAGSKSLFFAGYGDDPEGSKDIFVSKMQANGEWGPPERLPGTINSPFDEDYPVISGDGTILYFSSKGHNTIGGYDIFASIADTVTNTWSKPVNLDYAVNTPFDDFLFVPEKNGEYVWFSSTRSLTGTGVNVYKAAFSFEQLFALLNEQTDVNALTTLNETSHTIADDNRTASETHEGIAENAPGTGDDLWDDSILADSAFYLVNMEKDKLKAMKVTKERAYIISGEKKNMADQALAEMQQIPAGDPEKTDRYEELAIKNAQLAEMSIHAADIGYVIKKQIQIKEELIENWNGQASKVLETSATGTHSQTSIHYGFLKNSLAEADTFRNYSPLLDSIKNELIEYPVNIAVDDTRTNKEKLEEKPLVKDTKEVVEPAVVVAEIPAAPPAGNKKFSLLRAEADSCGQLLEITLKDLNRTRDFGVNQSLGFAKQYKQVLTDPGISASMTDSAYRHQLKDTLSFLARSSAVSFLIYKTADSIHKDLASSLQMEKQAIQYIEKEQLNEAIASVEALQNSMPDINNSTDVMQIVESRLPKPKESTVGQSERYLQIASQQLNEYNDLIEEADALKLKASKKKQGKKKKELEREAEKLTKRADLKYQNYLTNKEKGTDLQSAYNASVQNKAVMALLRYRLSTGIDEEVPYAFGNADDFELPLEFINCGFIERECPEIINGDISEAYLETGPIAVVPADEPEKENIAAIPRTFIFNEKGYSEKSGLLGSLLRHVQTEKILIDKKSQREQGQEFPAKRLQFISHLENFLTEQRNTYSKLSSEAASGGYYIISVQGAFKSAEEWMAFIREKGMEGTLDTSRLYLIEYQDAKSLNHLTAFLGQYIKIEQLENGLGESEDRRLANSYIEEAEFLLIKAIENRKKAENESSAEEAKYLLDDINTFEQAAIEQLGIAFSVYKSLNPQSESILAELDDNLLTTDLVGRLPEQELTLSDEKTTPAVTEPAENQSLLFRVQLIASGKNLDDSYFKGINPIFREAAGNTGVTRYLGGEYHSAEEAEQAKARYSSLGFPGAFVVAYNKGEKISMEEALAMKTRQPVTNTEKPEVKPSEEKPVVVANKEKPYDFSDFTGEGYFVQIGNFSSKKPPTEWNNIHPDYTEKTVAGTFRFYLGPAATLKEAETIRASADENGIKDAFIFRYINGKREPVEILQEPEKVAVQEDQKIIVQESPASQSQNVFFSIQIGAFGKDQSQAWIKERSSKSGLDVTSIKTDKGISIYMAGSFDNLDKAAEKKEMMKQEAIFRDVFVIAIAGGKKITVQQALDMPGN